MLINEGIYTKREKSYKIIGLWCNGSTGGFDPLSPGSSPGRPSNFEIGVLRLKPT